MEIEFNKYQSSLDELDIENMSSVERDIFFKYINSIPYISELVSINRPYAKDLERDKHGRIIVDLAHPHILTDMDFFRPSAIHYQQHGTYTSLHPNSNPQSEYGMWLRTELDRCWNGYVREEDGEWIPGLMYFYLNYCPILQTKISKKNTVARRVVDFPEVWEGVYWRFHYMEQARNGGKYNDFKGGQHGSELASRSKSKSYSLASVLARNLLLGEDATSHTNITSIVAAYRKEYLTKDGVLNKFLSIINFCAEHTQFPRRKIFNSMQDLYWQMGYKDIELDINRGSLNSVLGVSVSDDISKIRGKRASFIGIEEFGSFPKLLDLYNILHPSVQEGEYVFGLMYLQGTAGDSNSDFAGASEIMYNPKGYNMYTLPNVYDEINSNKTDFVYFFPGYINRKGCYNKDGVSDVTKALKEIIQQRVQVQQNVSNSETYQRLVAEIPITPIEAIQQIHINIFPVTDINARLQEIDADPHFYDNVYVGDLIFNSNKEINYYPSNDIAIRDFPHKTNQLLGAIEIYSLPQRDKNDKIYSNRYILGCDPYDDDGGSTSLSLGSVFVFDTWTDEIVAEFTGRPNYADDFYEKCRRLCIFYNGILNYENNKKGLFAYFSKMNSLYLLSDVLEFLRDKDIFRQQSVTNRSKGTYATLAINNYSKTLLRNWLLSIKEDTNTDYINDKDDKAISQTVSLHDNNLFKIKSRGLLKELSMYNNMGNFDRISALGMVMLLRESYNIVYKNSYRGDSDNSSKYLGNDKFFTDNYSKKILKNKNNIYF